MVTPDPSDKLDAKADGAFGGKPVNRRAGYGNQLAMALRIARKGGTLAAGEGLAIIEHYEALLADAYTEIRNQVLWSRVVYDRETVDRAAQAAYTSETPSTEV